MNDYFEITIYRKYIGFTVLQIRRWHLGLRLHVMTLANWPALRIERIFVGVGYCLFYKGFSMLGYWLLYYTIFITFSAMFFLIFCPFFLELIDTFTCFLELTGI